MKLVLKIQPNVRESTRFERLWRYLKGAHLKHALRKFLKRKTNEKK
jgi:hypothetical protein